MSILYIHRNKHFTDPDFLAIVPQFIIWKKAVFISGIFEIVWIIVII